jgi:hypothetical protein
MSRQKKAAEFLSGPIQIDLRKELNLIKAQAVSERKQKDLIWRKLCGVVATSGSVVHANEFMAMYDDRLAFNRLPENRAARTRAIFQALVDAKVPRMRKQKAEGLSSNYDLVREMGGPEAATKLMLSQKGKEQKMKWITQFHGVGSKYSRDIWMDICDPDFDSSVALDARVKAFSERLGFDRNAKDLEDGLLKFAKRCNLNGWELDRLIFNFGGLILRKI